MHFASFPIWHGECKTIICTRVWWQGWRQKFSDRGAGASDRGLKRLKNGVSVRYFAKVPPTRTKISSDGGLDPSDGEGCSPLALPWRHHCLVDWPGGWYLVSV